MNLKTEERDIVKKLLAQHVPDYTAFIFGSRAHGKNLKEFSDLDIVLTGSGKIPDEVLFVLNEAFSESDLPFKVDIVDWHAIDQSFQAIIERDKVPLV